MSEVRPGGSTTVLVVGAGPTGLALALVLARSGVPFRLIEAGTGPRPGSRGKGVQPRTLEVFEDLGVAEQVLAHGRLAMPMDLVAADGTVTHGGTVPPSLANRPDVPYATSLITPQWRVEEALRDRLHELGGAVEFGTALTGFHADGDGVHARVTSGGATRELRARWIVGTDGARSVTRRTAGVPMTGRTREDVRMALADLPVSGPGREAWVTWAHPAGLLTLCPLPSTDLFQLAVAVPADVGPALDRAHLQAAVEERTGRTDIRLHEPRWTSLWRANVRLADRYRAGDVFLAGDAAHLHAPAGGQGMNTGVQDAYNLGWKLAAVHTGAPPALLDTYEAERRPVAEHVLALSDARLAHTLRTNSVPVVRDASTLQLDVGYRGSVLSRDDRGGQADRDEPHPGGSGPLRAGDRAPDATGLLTTGGSRRLFSLLGGGRFTVLSFGPRLSAAPGPRAPRLLHVVPAPVGEGDVTDANGSLRRAYGAGDRTLVVIRPDGYVGLVSDGGDVGAVTDHLASAQR